MSSSEEEISAHVLVDDAILKDIQKLETLDMLDKINNIKSNIIIITYEVIFLFQDIMLTLLSMATSETGLARTRERAAKPRGAGERRACDDPLQIFICTSPRRREIPLAEK